MTYMRTSEFDIKNGDQVRANFEQGTVKNLRTGKINEAQPFSEVQLEIYKNGGLF